ncbi:MAG: hypothetical protein AABY18_05465 [Candidatus Thermoplasmatota archaeon]
MKVQLPRTDLTLLVARIGVLATAGLIEGLLLANSPVLERYAAVRLGPEGILIDVTLLCAIVLGAAGALAAFAPWAQAVFLGFVITTASWSLAESSQHPFWLFSNKGVWRPHPPSTGLVAAHATAIALVCCAALAEAMQKYRAAARAQGFSPANLARDTQRLATAGAALLAATALVVLPLIALLDGLANRLIGAVRGPAAFVILLGSAVLLLLGFGLLASHGTPDKTVGSGAAKDANGANGEDGS